MQRVLGFGFRAPLAHARLPYLRGLAWSCVGRMESLAKNAALVVSLTDTQPGSRLENKQGPLCGFKGSIREPQP